MKDKHLQVKYYGTLLLFLMLDDSFSRLVLVTDPVKIYNIEVSDTEIFCKCIFNLFVFNYLKWI